MMARRTVSPLSLLLCSLVFFCGQVFGAAAVLGVDLGTEYIKAALVKPGIPLDIVLTKDSRRKESSAVAFKPPRGGPKAGSYPERAYGSDALALTARFPGDVYPNLKKLLGLPIDSPVVQEYAARHPALQLEAHSIRQTAAFKSSGAFTATEEAWLVEELLAMELQSVRRNAEAMAGADTSVRSAVLTVPPFYTTEEKRAVEMAAELSGLRVLSLISDGLAVGLNYATSRQFPTINEGGKPEINMVFDMGAGNTKATILKFQSRKVKDVGKFNKTVQEVQVLGTGWDRTLGGDTLNNIIIDDMVAQFVGSSPAKAASVRADDVIAHGRAVAKLTKDAERLRHVLSANTKISTNFEGLFADIDFRYQVVRADFEKMAEDAGYVERVSAVVQQALDAAQLQASDLNSIILHGGATRTPFVQKQLEQIFGSTDKLRSNVNSDEAAVFGAGFRAAQISPSFRVKEIQLSEGAAYAAGMQWTNSRTQKTQRQLIWTPTSFLGAAAKNLTLNQREDFSLEFYQAIPSGGDEKATLAPTKVFTTKNLTDTVAKLAEQYQCESSAVHFKVSVQLNRDNGEVDILKAFAECETEEPEKESIMDGVKNLFGFGKNKDQQPLKDGDDGIEVVLESEADSSSSASSAASSSSSTESSQTSSSSASSSASSAATSTASSAAPSAAAAGTKKVIVSIPVQYVVEKAGIQQLSKTDMQKLKDRLKAFEGSDRARQLREETLNQLEAFTYHVREMLDNEEFVAVSTEAERATLRELGVETSEWLYGEGAEATREELKIKHTALHELADPIEGRITEHAKRPALISKLKEALEQSRSFTEQTRKHIEEYEQLLAAKSASTSSTADASSSSSSSSAAPSSEGGDFAGLEDDEAAAAAVPDSEEVELVAPLYAIEDLKKPEELYASVSAWLAEKEAAQAKLDVKENPVLKIQDLEERRAEVEKVSLDLALKAVRDFENRTGKKKKGGKAGKASKSSKTKTVKAKTVKTATTETAETAEPLPTDGNTVKHEEL